MFETPQEIKQPDTKGLWIGIIVAVVVIAGGGLFYMMSRGGSKQPAPAAASAPAPIKDADPIRDLKVQRATMDKDRTGTTALWLVSIENKSQSYSYSNIKYETTYVGADSKALAVNQGTIATTIGPGEEKNSQFSDALYPAGTAWYKFKITGATPAAAQ